MKMILLFTYVFLFAMSNKSWAQTRSLGEYFFVVKECSSDRTDNFWYSDSIFIIEQKVNFGGLEENDILILQPERLPYAFTYFDLRTKECFDYLSFSDTATPVNHYTMTENDVWFLAKDDSFELRRPGIKYERIGDTTLGYKKLQRVKATFINKEYDFRDETIYYLDCDTKSVLKSAISIHLPDCFISRIDLIIIQENYPQIPDVREFKLRDKLTNNEINVFTSWKKNAKTSQLPLSTYHEVLTNERLTPIKYRNHPFFSRRQ